MYISHKSNVLQQVHETEWQCRKNSKDMTKTEYWAWVETITDSDGVVTYPSESFTIVECTDEDVYTRLAQLDDYINHNRKPGETLVYNIKYYVSKRDSEIVDVEAHTIAAYTDEDGNDVAEEDVATTYVQSHFIGQDDTKDARLLAEQWTQIRRERDKLLTESDWTQANDTPLTDANVAKWKTYRTSLRDLPSDQSSKTKYSDITWPTKP